MHPDLFKQLGYTFCPDDEDLIGFLTMKILKMPICDPVDHILENGPEDIYRYNPQQLTDQYGIPEENSNHNEIYKFQLDRKHLEENYFTRRVADGEGEGCWKTHNIEPIIVDNTPTIEIELRKELVIIVCRGVPTVRHINLTEGPTCEISTREPKVTGKHIIGYKMSLVYYEGKMKHGIPTNWVMDEYMVNRNYLPNSSQGEKWVLCHIYVKKESNKEEESTDSSCESNEESEESG